MRSTRPPSRIDTATAATAGVPTRPPAHGVPTSARPPMMRCAAGRHGGIGADDPEEPAGRHDGDDPPASRTEERS